VRENKDKQNLREDLIRVIESQKNICDRYEDIRRINEYAGDGRFSLVFKAMDINNKRTLVALKFFDPFYNLPDYTYRQECFMRESDILKNLKGQKNILPLIQEKTNFTLNLKTENGIALPLQLIFYSAKLAKFNILDYIAKQETDYLTNILFFREMCKAVQRIHKKKIIHRDLKPSNFLVYNKMDVCLSDFGTGKYSVPDGSQLLNYYFAPVGDLRYTAPEMLGGLYFSNHHCFCADKYSLGAILFELFTKTILHYYVFKEDNIGRLITYFSTIPERSRIEVFDGFISSLSKSRELPSVRDFNNTIPKDISHQVDILYKRLACLDYRKRGNDFQRIFLRINICEKVIRYHEKIERLRRKKEENHAE